MRRQLLKLVSWENRQARVRTSLRNASPIDHGIGPAVAVDLFIPVILRWSTLGKNDRCVERTGNGVECNEAPKERLPFSVLETVRSVSRWTSSPACTHKSRFKNKLIEILRKMVAKIMKNSQTRNNFMQYAARDGSRDRICRPSPYSFAASIRPMAMIAIT